MTTLVDLALPRVVLVTGTGRSVGATVVTAALACLLAARGSDVAAVKPVQTGLAPGERGDADVIATLSGVTTHEWHRSSDLWTPDDPPTPDVHEGVAPPRVAAHARRLAGLGHDVVLAEGAGGLLVRLDPHGGTLADIGSALRYTGVSAGVLLVVSVAPDTLNTLALSVEALTARRLPLLGVVVGDWPERPGPAERTLVQHLPSVAGSPVLGVLPHGVGRQAPEDFRAQAPAWFSPLTWDTMGS